MKREKSSLDAPIYGTIITPKCSKCIFFIGVPHYDWKAKYFLCRKYEKVPENYLRKTEHDCKHFILDRNYEDIKDRIDFVLDEDNED